MKDEDIARAPRDGGDARRKGLRRRWDESGSLIVVRSDWTAKGKPT